MRNALSDVLAGLVFVGLGLGFAVGALSYEVGSPVRMGPGFFPLGLGILLTVLGVLIVVKGYIAADAGEIGEIPWRATILITASIVLFGLTVRGAGLVPSLVASTLLAGLAPRASGLVMPIAIAAGLTIVSILIFVVGLQLRLPLFGPWIPVRL